MNEGIKKSKIKSIRREDSNQSVGQKRHSIFVLK